MANEKEITDWYNQRHRSLRENAWRPYEAYPVFLDYLKIISGKKILDVGCGTGYLLKAAEQKGLKTYGIDISDEGIKIAKKISPNSKIVIGKGENLKFSDDFFDYVTCIGALEHFSDMEQGLREMLRVAKKDALFCIVVPNVNFLPWKIGKTKGTEQQSINENLRSLKEWKSILLKAGFEILKIRQDRWRMKSNMLSPVNLKKSTMKVIYRFAWLCLPLDFAYQFIFILRKKISVKY